MQYLKFSAIFVGQINKILALVKSLLICMLVLCMQTVFAAGPYTYSADGSEVTDASTGLVWSRCSAGQSWDGATCRNPAVSMTHEQALVYAGAQAGWRLPNVKELASIVDISRINPSINTEAFPNVTWGAYWTSSPYAGSGSFVWVVDFLNGTVRQYQRPLSYFGVRLVR